MKTDYNTVMWGGHIRANMELEGFNAISFATGEDDAEVHACDNEDGMDLCGLFRFDGKSIAQIQVMMQALANKGFTVHGLEIHTDEVFLRAMQMMSNLWEVDDGGEVSRTTDEMTETDKQLFEWAEGMLKRWNDEKFMH